MYSEFSDDTKLTFDGRLITVVTYRNLTDEQEDLLFMRINRHLNLSQGETINAMKSVPICQITHDMSEKYKRVMCDNKVGMSNCGRPNGGKGLYVHPVHQFHSRKDSEFMKSLEPKFSQRLKNTVGFRNYPSTPKLIWRRI